MNDEVLMTYGKKEFEDVRYWVYVLDCRDRFYYDDYDDLARRAQNRLDKEPGWLRQAWEANRPVYVGQTENLFKRLGQHFQNQNGSQFTQLFEPSGINKLIPCQSRGHAERTEEQVAKSYYGSERIFAYWN